MRIVLEDFGIVGVSWRLGGSEALAGYSLPADEQAARLQRFAHRAALAELVYLQTCNRVEIIFARTAETAQDIRPLVYELLTGRKPAPGEAERTLRAWQGEGACEHLFLVAAGLDSAAVGEAEIAGQVRAGHDQAQRLGLSGPRLALVFKEALRIGADVRSKTRLGAGSVSLAEVAMAHIRTRLRTSHRPAGSRSVALIGVSAMTERAALSLAKDGAPFVVVNRSVQRADALASRFDADALSLEDFLREPPGVEAVLSSTGATEELLTAGPLARLAANAPSGTPPPLHRLGRAGGHRRRRLRESSHPPTRHGRHRARSRAQPGRSTGASRRSSATGGRCPAAPARTAGGTPLRPPVRRIAAALSRSRPDRCSSSAAGPSAAAQRRPRERLRGRAAEGRDDVDRSLGAAFRAPAHRRPSRDCCITARRVRWMLF